MQYIQDLKARFNKIYALEDRGPAAYFLGVQIIRDRPNRLLWLHQSQYIEEALATFGLADCKPISVPLQPGVLKYSGGKPVNALEIKLLQRIIGTLMYLMLLTRPDIGFAVQWLSRFFNESHYNPLNGS